MQNERVLAGRGARLRALARDAVGLTGCGAVVYGCWLANPALGFVCGGVVLIALAILTIPKGQGEKR